MKKCKIQSSKPRLQRKPSLQHINETRSLHIMKNPFTISKNPIQNLSSSKILTKDSDIYNELSISYTSDFPEVHQSELILSNARSSLVDLRTEAQLYLDCSRRVTKRNRDSILSQNESMVRQSVHSSDHVTILLQSMHDSMRKINDKLELVNEKSARRDQESNNLRNSIVDLQEKILEIKNKKTPSMCSEVCAVI